MVINHDRRLFIAGISLVHISESVRQMKTGVENSLKACIPDQIKSPVSPQKLFIQPLLSFPVIAFKKLISAGSLFRIRIIRYIVGQDYRRPVAQRIYRPMNGSRCAAYANGFIPRNESPRLLKLCKGMVKIIKFFIIEIPAYFCTAADEKKYPGIHFPVRTLGKLHANRYPV